MQTTYKVYAHRAGYRLRTKSALYQASSQTNAEALFRLDNPGWVVDRTEDTAANTREARIRNTLTLHQRGEYSTLCSCGHYAPDLAAHQAGILAAVFIPRVLRTLTRS